MKIIYYKQENYVLKPDSSIDEGIKAGIICLNLKKYHKEFEVVAELFKIKDDGTLSLEMNAGKEISVLLSHLENELGFRPLPYDILECKIDTQTSVFYCVLKNNYFTKIFY